MAIVVEEEQSKNRQGLASFVTWGLILVIIGVAVYYVFFKRPELGGEVVTPANLANTEALSQIKLAPDEVINSASFKALQTYVPPIATPTGGRENPFLGNF